MKAAIVTINNPHPNYGNRLQNYASDYVLKKYCDNVTTLYVENQLSVSDRIKHRIHAMSFYKLNKNPVYYKVLYKKRIKFLKFNKKYLNMRKIENFSTIGNEYDYFCIGSDQVWNPSWYNDRKKEAYLLTFCKPEQKVCISPSFGINEIPSEWHEHFKKYLKLFPDFSVRENEGATIIKNYTGKDAAVLIDPTLMLSKEEWLKIAAKPKNIDTDKKYILTYFLGDISDEAKSFMDKKAKENNMVIYHLLNPNYPDLFTVDPAEFIYLVRHSDVIFTDSFHACVFSFIFGKPFCVCDRIDTEKSMASRIDTLLTSFKLERKFFNGNNDINECDYSESNLILAKRQQDFTEYIKNHLC